MNRLVSFDSLYGWAYDAAISNPLLAQVGLRLEWGADAGLMYAMMRDALGSRRDEVILDCPTGGGVAMAVAGARVRGLLIAADLSSAMLRRARHRQSSRSLLVRADASSLPIGTASIDRAGCFMSLHCIPDKAGVLGEMARVLKPGGRLLGTSLCSDPPMPWRLTVELARSVPSFFCPPRERELEQLGTAAGFDWRQHRRGAMLYFVGRRQGGSG